MRGFIKHRLAMACIFALVGSLPCYALSSSTETKDLQIKFFKRQVEQTMSVGRAIKSIASHYPQEIVPFVEIALHHYPKQYREIIFAAISAQPALTGDIVRVAIENDPNSCPSIVETAIKAEPSYVDFVVQAAAEATPKEMEEIIRVAVITEPDSADRIVQILAKEHPNKLVQILSTAMQSVPLVGQYMVDALLAIFPSQAEDVVTTAVRESLEQDKALQKIIDAAQNAGIKEETLKRYAIKGGASEEQIAKALNTTVF